MSAEAVTLDPKSREKKLFRLTLLLFLGLFIGAFIPIAGLVIFIPFFCTGLLWCYTGFAGVCLTFPIASFVAKRRGQKLMDSIVSGIRWSVIVFGALGLVLALSVLIVPGYKPFTLGYWIHSKIWLNPAQVRDWAERQKGTTGASEAVPYKLWPPTLK